jgi:hypothetical protein
MAAAKEPASIIAGRLRHADGGTLASRTYIHQLPQTPPRPARLIEDLYALQQGRPGLIETQTEMRSRRAITPCISARQDGGRTRIRTW